MFFQSNIIEPSRIDTILSSENPRLTEILDEDDVIQQCVGQNNTLLKFLCGDNTFEQMINFICTDPDPDLDVSIQYKYPSRACEVLTCEIPELTAKLADSEEYITRIFDFIDYRKHQVTHLQASFCIKLIQHLFKMKTKLLYDYMEKRATEMIAIIGSSLHLPCLVDLLLQFAAPVEDIDCSLPSSTGFLNPLIEAGFGGVLISALSPVNSNDISSEATCNAAYFMSETIRNAPSPMSNALLNDKSIVSLFAALFPPDTSVPEFVLYHGFGVINTILNQDHSGYDHNSDLKVGNSSALAAMDDFDNIDAPSAATEAVSTASSRAPLSNTSHSSSTPPKRQLPDYVQRVFSCLLGQMTKIRTLIDNAPPQYPSSRLILASTVNAEKVEEIAPLGRLRLRLVETIQLLVEQRDSNIDNAIAESDLLQSIFRIFLCYKWNSLLHNMVERICSTILSTSGADKPLLSKLLVDCNFVRTILDSFHDKDKLGNKCPGYSGQILLIANHFNRALENNKGEIAKLLPVEILEEWRKFVVDTLDLVNERNRSDRLSVMSANNASSSTMMMMMSGGFDSGTLSIKGQRVRYGRNAKTGISGDDDIEDDDDEMEDSDRHDDSEQFSIDSVLRQMQSEYHKQDLSAKSLTLFKDALSSLELDPQKAILGNLPSVVPMPLSLQPPDRRRKNADSSDESDEDMEDPEKVFESACDERVKVSSRAPVAKPQKVSDESGSSDDDDDNLWRDVEVQQGSFETAKNKHARHMFEDSQGNIRDVKESEWNPFISSTPDQNADSSSPPNKSGLEHMDDDGINDSDSSGKSSGEDEASDFSPFADFSAVSGSEWPVANTSAAGEATTAAGGDDWPGVSGNNNMETSFEAKFTDLFPGGSVAAAGSNDDAITMGEPQSQSSPECAQQLLKPDDNLQPLIQSETTSSQQPPRPARVPPAIPPRGRAKSPLPSENNNAT